MFLDEVLEDTKVLKEMRNESRLLAFADDIALIHRSKDDGMSAQEEAIAALNEFIQIENKWGLAINLKKTEVMIAYPQTKKQLIEFCKQKEILLCKQFKYLGITVCYDTNTMIDLNYKKAKGILAGIWNKSYLADPKVATQIWNYWVASYLRFYFGPFIESGTVPAKDLMKTYCKLFKVAVAIPSFVS